MAPFYGCRDPGTKLDGVKLAPVTAKTSKTGPRHGANPSPSRVTSPIFLTKHGRIPSENF